jgi:hypothetical protein
MQTIFWGIDKSENDVAIPAPVTQAGVTAWRNIFQVWIHTPLLAGDVVEIRGAAQIALDGWVNTEMATQVILTPGAPFYHNDIESSGVFLQPTAGENVDRERHYYAPQFSGGDRLPWGFPNGAMVSARLRCRSSSATGNEFGLIREGYGRLIVEVRRG